MRGRQIITAEPPELRERDVMRLTCDFLLADRWRLFRMNVATVQFGERWVPFGEKGMPDYLALYYLADSLAAVLWLEFKAPRGRLSRIQELWHARERKDGATICVVNDFDSFREFYRDRFDRDGSPVKGQRELLR